MWKYLQLQPSHSTHGTSLIAMFVGLGVFLIPLLYTHVTMWRELNEPEVSLFKETLSDLKSAHGSLERSQKKGQSLSADDVFDALNGVSRRDIYIPTRALDDEGEARIQAAVDDYAAWIRKEQRDNLSGLSALQEGKEAVLHFDFAEGSSKLEEISKVATASLSRPVILRPEFFLEMYYVVSPILFLAVLFRALLRRASVGGSGAPTPAPGLSNQPVGAQP